MSKQLITALGLVVSLGVVALGLFLVAMPIYFQSVTVDGETAQVANVNAIYQAQVDMLHEQSQSLDQINASVTGLRAQIPATGQYDDLFEVIANAAATSQVTITAVTAGTQTVFTSPTGSGAGGVATAPAPAPTPAPTDPAGTDGSTEPGAFQGVAGSSSSGRQQIDFAIQVDAADMSQATAFLDALRAGPRLLSNVTATSTQTGQGAVSVQVMALAYVDSEG